MLNKGYVNDLGINRQSKTQQTQCEIPFEAIEII